MTRVNPLAFTSGTSLRFTILVTAAAATTWDAWKVIAGTVLGTPYSAATRQCVQAIGATLGVRDAQSRATVLAQPADASVFASAVKACSEQVGLTATRVALAGVLLLFAGSAAAFWFWPRWHIRRRRLIPFPTSQFASLGAELEALAERAGERRVTFLLAPADRRVAGRAFGRPGRRYVAISRGLAMRYERDPGAVRAVVAHELAHLRNRDLDPGYAAVWTWRLLVVVTVAPTLVWALYEMATGQWWAAWTYGWRIVVLTTATLLVRNWLLRTRETYADIRAAVGAPQLADLLRAQPGDGGWREMLRLHPSARRRAQLLDDPRPMTTAGFWATVAVGVTAMLSYDLVDALALLTGVRSAVTAIAGMTVVALLATWGVCQGALRSALAERFDGRFSSGRSQLLVGHSSYWFPGSRAGLGLGLGLVAGRLLSLDPVSHGVIGHDRSSEMSFLYEWSTVLCTSCYVLVAWTHIAARTWLPLVARTDRRHLAAGAMTVCASAIMLPWLPPMMWAYFVYANLPWERAGVPSWVTTELILHPHNVLIGWRFLACMAGLVALALLPKLWLRPVTVRPWVGLGAPGMLSWRPPTRVVVRTLFASGLIVVVWGQYGFRTAAWPGADITSMALMATSPASRTAVSAAPNGAPKELCHTWGNLHTGIHAQCTMLQWFRDPFQQWCRRQPTPPPACRRPAAPSSPPPDLALRQVGRGGYRPHRAEMVLFDDKIARWSALPKKSYRMGLVIGVPGDHVSCMGNGAPILVNGWPAVRGTVLFPTPPTAARAFDLTVPDGRLWVEASIAMPSDDSSDHLDDPGGGTVPTAAVVAFFSR